MDFISVLKNNPVIAALRSVKDFRVDELSNTAVLFIIGGTIFDLPELVKQAEKYGKLVFLKCQEDVHLIAHIAQIIYINVNLNH